MAGPWEKYAKPESGPWTKYAKKPAENVIATTSDGGRVIQRGGGLAFVSPSYSTTDQNQIARIMEGATPAEVSTSGFDQATIAQAPVTARAVKAVEGVPFVGSYVDEAAGAMFGDDAKQGVRAVSGAMNRENPGQSTALGIGGAIAGTIPMAMAAAPSLIARAGQTIGTRALQGGILGAATGGIEGLVHGAGRSEGGGRQSNAAEGGMFGTVLGGAFGAAAPYMAQLLKSGLERVKGSDVAAIRKQFGLSAPAARVVKNALDAGDMDGAMTAFLRAGDDAMLADAGQPAQQLLDAAVNTGGKASRIATDAVDGRVARASGQVTGALDDTLGKPTGVNAMARSVREGTAAARGGAYDAAYAQPINYAGDGGTRLQSLLKRVPQSAINDANELMRLDGHQSAQIMAKIADDGSVTFERLPDVRQLDYIARALGGVADKADGQGKLGGQTPLGLGYKNLQTAIRTTLKREVPEYAKALDVAADAISRVKAGETGYSLLRPGTTRETVSDALQGASKAERDAMKQGVRTFIDDQLANVTTTLTDPNVDAREALKALRSLSSRANQTKMKMLLGSGEADKMFAKLDEATTAFELRAALAQNSKTAIRQSIQGGVRQQTAPGTLETLASGKPVDAAKRFVQIFTGSTDEAQALREAGIYEEIATALTTVRGRKASAALKAVQRAMNGQSISEQEASFIGTVLATQFSLSGSHASRQQLSK